MPVSSRPTPGVANATFGSDEFAVFPPSMDLDPTMPGVQLNDAGLTIEPRPDSEQKGLVRIEVVDGSDGNIASCWASYHLICEQDGDRPSVTSWFVGVGVVSL